MISHLQMESEKARIRSWKSNFEHPSSSHTRVLLSHEFNFSFEVLVPCQAFADKLSALFDGVKFYRGKETPIKLLELEGWSFLSEGTRVQLDDSIAICAAGEVIVSLSKETHEKAGLDGNKSRYNQRIWRSVVDLKKDSRKRLCAALERLPPFAVVACHADATKELQAPFQSKSLTLDSRAFSVESLEFSGDVKEEMNDALQYVGAVMSGVLLRQDQSQMKDFISDYAFPFKLGENNVKSQTMCFSGMISAQQCLIALGKVRHLIKENECEWAAVTVRGFDDAPISWGQREHGSGENLTMFFFKKNDDYFGYVISGENDELPI